MVLTFDEVLTSRRNWAARSVWSTRFRACVLFGMAASPAMPEARRISSRQGISACRSPRGGCSRGDCGKVVEGRKVQMLCMYSQANKQTRARHAPGSSTHRRARKGRPRRFCKHENGKPYRSMTHRNTALPGGIFMDLVEPFPPPPTLEHTLHSTYPLRSLECEKTKIL